MNNELLGLLQHSLGVNEYGQGDMYRNHFCAGGRDVEKCRELVSLGLMVEQAPNSLTGGSIPFFVTQSGKDYVLRESPKPPKLSKAKIRYKLYLRSESDQTFFQWLTDPYWNDYRKSCGC